MTTLTYEDLLSIREALTERQGTKQGLLRKVESLIEDERQYRSLDTMRPNAETLAAMREEDLVTYASVQEAMKALNE